MQIPLGTGSYESDSLPFSAQQAVNVYPNIPQVDNALSGASLNSAPGLDRLLQLPTIYDFPNRGMHIMDGQLYIVCGTTLWLAQVVSDSAGRLQYGYRGLGSIYGEGPVSIADNGSKMMIVARVEHGTSGTLVGSVYDSSVVPGTLTAISDADFWDVGGLPETVVFIDGYFLATYSEHGYVVRNVYNSDGVLERQRWRKSGRRFSISSLNDPTSWNALDFGSAEADPDGIVAPFVYLNQLYIFGDETIEKFQNLGGSSFPFQRVSGGVIDTGCRARDSVVKGHHGVYFLGAKTNEDVAAYRLTGNGTEKISTTGIDIILQKYEKFHIDIATAMAYANNGHYFVCFNLRDTTIVYDESTNKWHERKSRINDVQTTWRAVSSVFFLGDILVGDSQDGSISKLSENVFQDRGEAITREFVSPPIVIDSNPFTLEMVQLTVESGTGNSDDTDPQMEMCISKDGKTWSDWRARSMGKIGENDTRLVWWRNGDIPRFCYLRFRCSDDVDVKILRLDVEAA